MSTTPQTTQIVNEAVLAVTRNAARASQAAVNQGLDTELDQPLRLRADLPASSKLFINAAQIAAADGSSKSVAPQSGTVNTLPLTSIDFATSAGVVAGGTVTLQGAAFSMPATTAGQFVRMAFVFTVQGTIDCAVSAPAGSVGALANAGTIFAKLSSSAQPIGWVDLCALATGWKTANSAGTSPIIEPATGGTANIFRFGAGAGGGSGSGGTAGLAVMLRDEFVDSPYQLLTSYVAQEDGDGGYSLSGAVFDFSTNTVKFTADGQFMTSVNLLDVNEFFPQGVDVGSVDLTVQWNLGSATATLNVPTAFTYNVSRDGGTTYFPVTMTRVGTTNVFRGKLTFGTSTTTETTFVSVQTISGAGTGLDTINNTTQGYSQTVAVPAGTNFVLTQQTLTLAVGGTPVGNLFFSVYASSGGLPTGSPLSQTRVAVSSLVNGSNTIALTPTILQGGAGGTTYVVAITADAQYLASSGSNTISVEKQGPSSGMASFDGTTWTSLGAIGILGSFNGRYQALMVQVVAAGSPTYPCGLDGFGIFYNLQDTGIVGAVKKVQRFVFNSVTDNLSTFALNWSPDPDLVRCHWVEGGQTFVVPAFTLHGNTAVFPANSFNQGGVSQTITLVFDQNCGASYDNSDSNARLMAANHLGSTNGSDDKSASGRGILLRNAAGVLVELALDSNNNIIILSTP